MFCLLWLPSQAEALDIDGAWALDRSRCAQVFSQRRKATAFSNVADVHGGGFIVQGDWIRSGRARCRIKSRKDGETIIHILATCANNVMLSDVQMSLKVIDPNKVARIFPGMEAIEVSYERCGPL
jgi:hypothetical protein